MLDENLSVENQEVAEPEIESTEDLGVETFPLLICWH